MLFITIPCFCSTFTWLFATCLIVEKFIHGSVLWSVGWLAAGLLSVHSLSFDLASLSGRVSVWLRVSQCRLI